MGIQIDKYLVSPADFYFELPLYYKVNLAIPDIADAIFHLLRYSGKVEGYCIYCKKESVFHTLDSLHVGHNGPTKQTYINMWTDHDRHPELCSNSHECVWDAGHRYTCYFRIHDGVLQKVGQFPSTADLQIPQVQKYRQIIGDEGHDEFVRGIGLAAHGVGIGSFVYLRRVFENLIDEAKIEALKDNGSFPVDKYTRAKMDDKIAILKDHLPKFLVENKAIYSILSKGIHELTEDECLEYFLPIKTGIELILDEKIEVKAKAEKYAAAQKAIQHINQTVS